MLSSMDMKFLMKISNADYVKIRHFNGIAKTPTYIRACVHLSGQNYASPGDEVTIPYISVIVKSSQEALGVAIAVKYSCGWLCGCTFLITSEGSAAL